MKLIESEKLREWAANSNKTAMELSEKIISELQNRKILEDTTENYGASIYDLIVSDDMVFEVIEIMRIVGIEVNNENYNSILELTIVGNGKCSECGGNMVVTDGEYKEVCGDGYITEIEYMPIWEEETCLVCGNKQSSEPSY